MQVAAGRAAIGEVDPKSNSQRIFASGLRNPYGLAWEPDSGALGTVVNARDEQGIQCASTLNPRAKWNTILNRTMKLA